jgi:hypothetical protein
MGFIQRWLYPKILLNKIMVRIIFTCKTMGPVQKLITNKTAASGSIAIVILV